MTVPVSLLWSDKSYRTHAHCVS